MSRSRSDGSCRPAALPRHLPPGREREDPSAGGEIRCQVQRLHDVNEAIRHKYADHLVAPA